MTKALGVAKYIIEKQPVLSYMQLQILLYYVQAWHTVWVGETAFSDPIKLRDRKPVISSVDNLYHRDNQLTNGNIFVVPNDVKLTTDSVLNFFTTDGSIWEDTKLLNYFYNHSTCKQAEKNHYIVTDIFIRTLIRYHTNEVMHSENIPTPPPLEFKQIANTEFEELVAWQQKAWVETNRRLETR